MIYRILGHQLLHGTVLRTASRAPTRCSLDKSRMSLVPAMALATPLQAVSYCTP